MFTEFKLEHIEETKRLNSSYEGNPDWKNKIIEIQNRFSEIIDTLRRVIPGYASYTEDFGCHEWTPFWIAVVEVQDQFDLDGDNSETEYKINHETLEITLAEE